MKVQIYRCRKPVSLEALKSHKEMHVIDASLLYGSEHLEFAIQSAKRAILNGENISSNIFVETIVRASGQRQIKKALKMYGVKGSKEVAVFGEKRDLDFISFFSAEETVIKLNQVRIESLKEAFQITEEEICAVSKSVDEALKNLINERIALVAIQ